ncbi:MAG: LytTR family DNA-binding domain-containing protein [Deltaproteobacteria bacterium]|nr:LytTR family DNA-binding domain-containing protein [Deltaproteobacteria bacterium]MCF8119951.1 LytTR family DNA-binding domain-containing protein [Deltaproteobacteria bacterium]
MNNPRAVIADDEASLRRSLRTGLSRVWPELLISGEAKNGIEALDLIRSHHPDIAFLDIRMPGLTGMEVAEKVADSCRIVFVTAYDEYAVEAFEKAAVDYLLKPVSPERLHKTVRRLQEELEQGAGVSSEILRELIIRLSRDKGSRYLQHIRVQHGDGVRLILVDDILYFKASDKYTLVITHEGESLIRTPIRELAESLDPERFWQIHRGSIVNVRAIDRVSRSLTGKGVIRLKGCKEPLKVSNRHMHLFRQM